MKHLLTFLFSVSVIMFLSDASASAQGKAPGNGPSSVSQGHGQGTGRDQGKSSDTSSHDTDTNWQKKFNERLRKDPSFASRIDKLLPTGTDLTTTESGFKNGGQFIAALHVSRNLNIPFDQLKAKMTGVSGPTTAASGQTTSTPMSLGKAIHELRPSMTEDQANDQAKRAEKQATETDKNSTKASE
jgi:hypothetical protein